MTYPGAAILVLFLLGMTSVGWYWLFKRFERRMSERFDDTTERTNENFRILEIVFDRVYNLPNKADQTFGEVKRIQDMAKDLDKKLDLLQGLLLVIKQDRFLEAAERAGHSYRREGRLDEKELTQLTQMLKDMRLENLSRY